MEITGTILLLLATNWVNEAQIKPLCEDPKNCQDPHEIVLQQREQVVEETFMDFVFEGKPIRLSLSRKIIEKENVRKRYVNSSRKVTQDPFKKTRGRPLSIDKPVKVVEETLDDTSGEPEVAEDPAEPVDPEVTPR